MLKPQDWYELGHGLVGGTNNLDNVWTPQYSQKCNLWVPPPAVAGNTMEELIRSRHMNPRVPHIFVCPRLMTYGWRKSLMKTAGTIFYVAPGSKSFWPKEMHEPLLIDLVLPFIDVYPWQLRRSPKLLELERQLQDMWNHSDRNERSILRRFWQPETFRDNM